MWTKVISQTADFPPPHCASVEHNCPPGSDCCAKRCLWGWMFPAQWYHICLLVLLKAVSEKRNIACVEKGPLLKKKSPSSTVAQCPQPSTPLVMEYTATKLYVHYLELCHFMCLQLTRPCDPGQRGQEVALTSTWVFPSPEAGSLPFFSSFSLSPGTRHRNWHGHGICSYCELSTKYIQIISQSLGCIWNMSRWASWVCLLFYPGIWTIVFLISEPTYS